MSFSKQMEVFMLEHGLKHADIVKRTGLAYASIFKYLSGDRQPGAEALVKIANGLDISLDWLLLGRGECSLVPKKIKISLMEQERLAEEAEFLRGLKLGDILLLGKRGAQKQPWKVLIYLGKVGEKGGDTTGIFENVYNSGELGSTHDMIHDLAYLLNQGLVLPMGVNGNRYRRTREFTTIPSTNRSDVGQHTAHAMSMMANVINTEIMRDPESGCIVTAQAWCDPEDAERVITSLVESSKNILSKQKAGTSQVSLVIGVARTEE